MKNIYYRTSGKGSTALLFIHGWLGNADWWDGQVKKFSQKYQVVQMDLPSHGRSGSVKIESSTDYAQAITAVAHEIDAEKVILIGHSMSGAYVLEAYPAIKNCSGIVIIDTLKDLDQLTDVETAEKMMFSSCRSDFSSAVENFFPKFLFTPKTPAEVQLRLKKEFLSRTGEEAVEALRPLYAMNVLKYAKEVEVPVVAINSAYTPTSIENNRKYIKSYDAFFIEGTGHYPMLEDPENFNNKLEAVLNKLLS